MVSQPTVAERQGSSKHAFADEAEPRGWRGLFARRSQGDDAPPPPFAPDEQSRWIATQVHTTLAHLAAEVHKLNDALSAPGADVPSPHGAHPTALLRELVHLALDLEVRRNLDHRMCIEALRPTMERFSQGARTEQDAEDTFARRGAPAAAHAVRTAQMIEAAVLAEDAAKRMPGLAVVAEVDTRTLAHGISAATTNAYTPQDQTLVGSLEPIADGMPDPRTVGPKLAVKESGPGAVVLTVTNGSASPVHPVGDGTAPPMPDEAPHAPEPLPHRVTAEPEGVGAVDPEPTGVIASRETRKPAGGESR